MSKVLVTGANGFIGRHLVRHFLRNKCDVLSIVRRHCDDDAARDFLNGSTIRIAPRLVDISDADLNGATVFHCAWEGVHQQTAQSHFFHVSEQLGFLKKLLAAAPAKIIATGTLYEYGRVFGPVSVTDNTSPVTPYATAKDFLRAAVGAVSSETNIPCHWVRLCHVYGEGQSASSVYPLLLRAVERGEKTFDMTYGEQLSDYMAIDAAVTRLTYLADHDAPALVNLATGTPQSLRRVLEGVISQNEYAIDLNLGHYAYRAQDSLAMWGQESFEEQLGLDLDFFKPTRSD